MRPTPKLVGGVLIAVLGVLFTLDNLHIVHADDLLRFWPAGLIAVGVATFIQARTTASHVGAVAWMAVGTLLLLNSLHVLTFDIWDLAPLLLVAAGGALVWQALAAAKPRPVAAGGPPGEAAVRAFAILSGIERKVRSRQLQRCELTAVMGGCEIDLRDAAIDGREAVVDAIAMMGGVEIRVPESWAVQGQVFPLMGGFVDKSRPPKDPAAPRLIVRGVAIMGGIEVSN